MPDPSFEERRSHLIQAATRVFAEKGFTASNKEIAREAGITAAALYWYFPSKEELFWAVATQKTPDVREVRAVLSDDPDLPPEVLLPRFVNHMSTALMHPDMLPLYRIMLQEAMRNQRVAAIFEEKFIGPLLESLREYFAHQVGLGNVPTGDPLAYSIAFIGPFLAMNLTRNILQFEGLARLDVPLAFKQALSSFLYGIRLRKEETPGG